MRELYVGPNPLINDEQKEIEQDKECILVMNNWDRVPTAGSMELYAWRLYLAQRSCDVNVSAQRFPVMVVGDEKQRLMLENLYSQYDGNKPFIFGNKNQLLLYPNRLLCKASFHQDSRFKTTWSSIFAL